jgi:PKD repeat protein
LWPNNQISIRKYGIPQPSTSEKVIPVQLEIGTSLSTFEISSLQDGVITSSIEQAGITQNSIIQPSTPQVGIIQTSTSQISPTQDRRLQITTSQVSTFEATPSQIGTSKIGTTQIGSLEIASHQITPSQFSSDQTGTGKIIIKPRGFGEIDSSQIAIDSTSIEELNSSEFYASQISLTENKTSANGLTQIQLSKNALVDLKPIFNINSPKIYPTEIATFKNTIPDLSELEVSASEIGISKFTPQFNLTQIQSSKVSYPSLVTSSQLFPSNLSHDNSSLLTNIYNNAQTLWHTTTPIDLAFKIQDLPTGQLAEGTITSYNTNGTAKTATITIDDDANGIGWFLDTTPQDNNEFTGVDNYLQAAPNSAAAGKYDLLTAIMHEMGHTLGIINGYSEFDKHVKNNIFITDTLTTKLTPDGSHLDSTLYPYDLMNTSLKPGVRKLPSTMDWVILNAINSGVANSMSGVATVNPAHLTAGALIGITNGDFTTPTTWNTAGATNIINDNATLTEQSQKLSELTQAFIIPTGAKTLQFTIKDNHLIPGDTTKTANDAFEVALLDTNTYSSIVTIDLTQVTPTTQATLYFNLLGFGARTSTVTIDDVKLFTDTQPIPVTKNDTLTLDQNTPLTLDPTQLTTNDTNVTQIQIINQPTHGTLTLNPPLPLPGGDFTYTYTPNPTYIGNDSFTYLGFGSDGQISNLATVNLTVNNLPPTIETLTIPNQINEGQNIQLSATATDGGSSDNLTYTWNLGDGSNPITGQNIAHTYTDNGNYQVNLTVTDKDGGTTNQTTQIKVDNVAPTATITTPNTTLNQGETLNLGVNYSDPGIKDTHTMTWNFDDSSNPVTLIPLGFEAQPNLQSHTFTKAGNHNVTVTITDNDGASTTKAIQIAVTNIAPTITNLNIPTNINEGQSITLTYSWNFGDNTTPVSGQAATHTFADNGDYNVVLTVTDKDGAATTQTVIAKVDNVAPVIVNIDKPTTIKELFKATTEHRAKPLAVAEVSTLNYSSLFHRFSGTQSISSLSKALAMTKSTRSSID